MKNLMLVFFVMTAMVFTNSLQAQTACTAAQKEACKKVCSKTATCTPEQMAACKKICNTKAASATSAKLVNQSPEDNNKKACSKSVSTSAESPVKLVGFETEAVSTEKKKTECAKTCKGKKKEK